MVALDDELARGRIEARVELRVLLQGERGGLEEKARQGEREAAFPRRLDVAPDDRVELGDVGAIEVRHMGNERGRERHALGDRASQMRQRLALHRPPLLEPRQRRRLDADRRQRLRHRRPLRRVAGCRSRGARSTRAAEPTHVVVGDAPTRSGPSHHAQIHAKLPRQPPRRRRRRHRPHRNRRRRGHTGRRSPASTIGRSIRRSTRRPSRSCDRNGLPPGEGGAAGRLAGEWGSEAGGPPGRATPSPAPNPSRVVERDEHVPNLDALARPNVNASHAPAERRRNLDGRLVGLDLEQRRVFGEHIALVDENLQDLGLGESLAQVWEYERSGHGYELGSPVADDTAITTLRTRESRGRRRRRAARPGRWPSRARNRRRARRTRSRAGSGPRARGRRHP